MSSASRDRRESRGSHGESDDDDDDSTDLDDENYHEVAEKKTLLRYLLWHMQIFITHLKTDVCQS